MLKKSSPLKHKEQGHLILTEDAHKEAHGGEIPEENNFFKDPTQSVQDQVERNLGEPIVIDEDETIELDPNRNPFSLKHELEIIEREEQAEAEEEKAVDFVKTQAATDFDNYKEKNKDKLSTVYAEGGKFKNVLDYENTNNIININKELTLDHLRNNKYIWETVWPDVRDQNAKLIDQKAEELREKYKIDENSTQKDLDAANNEMMEFQSGFLNDDPRYQNVVKAYTNSLNKQHGIDENAYMVDKHTWGPVKDLDAYWNLKTGMAGPMTIYKSIRGIGTSLDETGLAGDAMNYQQRNERYQSNLRQAQENNWEDDQIGYENSQGDFKIQKKGAYPVSAHDYTEKTTWAEHKKKMSKKIRENEERYKVDTIKLLEEQRIDQAYEAADFDRLMTGDNTMRELSLMVGEQGVNMVGALLSYGTLPAMQEGASVYSTLMQDAAREKFDLSEDEMPTPDQLYQTLMDDSIDHDAMMNTAGRTGFAIGQLERIGAGKALNTAALFRKGGGSLLKGQYKRFLRDAMATGKSIGEGGFTEFFTEGAQTAASSIATGHWSGDEFRQSMGTGAVMGMLLPFGGSVRTRSTTEIKAAYNKVIGKFDKNTVENILNSNQKDLDQALKNGNITKEEHNEKSMLITDVRNSNDVVPNNFSLTNKTAAVDLLTKKAQLQREVDKSDPSLSKAKKEQIDEINTQLEEVGTRDQFEKEQEKVERIAGQIFGTNVKAKNITPEEAIGIATERYKSQYNEINEKLKDKNISKEERNNLLEDKALIEEQIQDAGSSFGFYDADNRTMFLNKEASVKQGFVTTGSHEFLHAVLQNTLKTNPDIAVDLGNALGRYLEKIDVEQIADSEYAFRVSQYQNAPDNVRGEEMITLLSEAMQRGDIKFNESVFTDLKDTFRRFLQKIGLKKIEFNTGEDIYNFVKDYNKAVQSGKVGEGIKNLAIKGAAGQLIKPTATQVKDSDIKLSKGSAANVNELYENKGVDAAGQISMEYQGMAKAIFNRNLAAAPSEDIRNNLISNKDLIIADILYNPGTETAKARTVLGLVKDYPAYVKKQKGKGEAIAPLSGFINNMIGQRSKEVFKPYGVDMALTKSMEQEGIAREAEGVETTVLPKLKKQREFMGIKVHEKLGTGDARVRGLVDNYQSIVKELSKDMSIEDVRNMKFKDVVDLAPEITAEIFGIDAAKLTRDNPKFGHNLRKDDKKGTNEQLSAQMLAAKNAAALKVVLPKHHTTKLVKDKKTGKMVERPHESINVPPSILQEYYTKGKRIGNLTPFYLNEMADSDFLEPLGIINKRSFRNDRRKSQQRLLNLAQLAGKTMTYQAIKEQKLDEGYSLNDLQTISDGANPLAFSKNIGKIKDPEEKATLYTKLSEIYPTYINHGKSVESAFNVLFPDMFGVNRRGLIKDFENYIQTYEQAEQIAKEVGIPIEKTIEEYITQETQEVDLAANMRELIGLGKGSIDFKNKEQLESVRNSIVQIAHKLGWEKAQRFLPFLYASGKIGGTKLAHVPGVGLVEDAMFDVGVRGRKKYKETESLRYGLFKGVTDFNEFVLSGLDGWTKDSKSGILPDAKQNVNVDVSTPALAKVNKDSANKNKKFLVELMDISSDLIAEGKMNRNDLGMIMMSLAGDMRTPLAAAAHVSHTTEGPKNSKTHVYEHLLPRKVVGLYLANYAVDKTNKTDVNKLLNQFSVAIIPKTQDGIVKDAGYKDSMPKDWLLGDNLLKRYFNIKTFGKINLPLTDVMTGQVDPKSQSFADAYNTIVKDSDKSLKFSKAIRSSRVVKEPKGITVLDFDDTLATTESLVRYVAPDGTKGTLNAEQYASTYQDLQDKGYTFDFTDFNKVVKGKLAPLFNKAVKLQGKFGPKNMFVLTARAPESQKAIYDFLQANGLNIPLENITGLGNSTSEAKALWMADKVAEGYNDFYFADDALQNVQAVKNMLDQFDVKSKIQQAKLKFSKDLNTTFNTILEQQSGVGREKVFGRTKAQLRGKTKGKFKFFIPYSAEDFNGLVYAMLPKGKKGEAAYDFFKESLLNPYSKAINELNMAKQTIGNDYKALRKAMPDVRKKLTKKIPSLKDYHYADAVRVKLWDSAGFEVPGLSNTDKNKLIDIVNNDERLNTFAETLGLVSKRPEGYVQPQEHWLTTNILGDLSDAVDKVGRKEFLNEWIENKNIIFSPENLNKLEAVYGTQYREALDDMLYRMETGTNRTVGDNKLVNAFMNWTNNSVGAIMFFNARSAVLQTLSSVNFINWGDNNIAKASLAFANQPQYWKDFSMIFNSDMLKQRRKGLKTDVNHAELTESVGRSKKPAMAALNYLLQKGFLPTQIADSFAIASGGSTFYRNRVKTYIKQGIDQNVAETRAFQDFQQIAEATQQSSRPDFISQQQASALGRLILAFQNTPMQYMRLTKRAMQDLVKGRGDAKTHVSRILYYGAIQNVIFYGLQTALFALAFDDEQDDEKRAKEEETKYSRMMNGMLDTILRGTGVGGAVVSTIKNVILKLGEEQKKGWNRSETAPLVEALNLSPPIGSKARKMVSAQKSWNYNEDVIKKMDTFDLDNPIWDAVGNIVSFSTNVPLDRLVKKTKNIREALNDDNEAWQRVALALGWNRWDLGMDRPEKVQQVKEEIKQEKKQKKKIKDKVLNAEKNRQEEQEKQDKVNENIKKQEEERKKGKEVKCAATNKSGQRCRNKVVSGKSYCTIHEKVEQNVMGVKSQCKKIKTNGKRCKMQTSAKSGYCYYHD